MITAWWFVRKGDTWRVRLRSATPAFIDQITTALLGQETVRTWSETIYEPETHAFGGPAGMDIAHDLFHADCRHLLNHLAHADQDHRRELAVILATRLLRAAGQEWSEQGDCWTQLATHRIPELGVVEPSPSTVAAMHWLITATTDTAGSPLHTAPTWVDAVEHAGRRLADLAGYYQVQVICGDGALGHPAHAPYQRIIVTAEAWDLVPAWWDQLTVDGRLVVPLRLHGSGLSRATGFTRHQPDQMGSETALARANTGPQMGWLEAATGASIMDAMATLLAKGPT